MNCLYLVINRKFGITVHLKNTTIFKEKLTIFNSKNISIIKGLILEQVIQTFGQ